MIIHGRGGRGLRLQTSSCFLYPIFPPSFQTLFCNRILFVWSTYFIADTSAYTTKGIFIYKEIYNSGVCEGRYWYVFQNFSFAVEWVGGTKV